jgi:hypothetical protein
MINEMPSQGQKIETKSPEEIKFEELVKDAKSRPLKGNYAFVETAEDERRIHQESMEGAYWESGDPEKMAIFKLQEAKINLVNLSLILEKLEKWDGQQKEKGFLDRAVAFAKKWKKGWEDGRDKNISELQTLFPELGLTVPRTAEEARTLKLKINNFENFKKLTEKYKKELLQS